MCEIKYEGSWRSRIKKTKQSESLLQESLLITGQFSSKWARGEWKCCTSRTCETPWEDFLNNCLLFAVWDLDLLFPHIKYSRFVRMCVHALYNNKLTNGKNYTFHKFYVISVSLNKNQRSWKKIIFTEINCYFSLNRSFHLQTLTADAQSVG